MPLRRVMDFVDVDSAKWTQYAANKPWPLSWIYRREGVRLLALSGRWRRELDASVFVTVEEAALFRSLAPEIGAERVVAVANGVDTAYFDPARAYPNPYPAIGERVLVFTGAMDYWANIDAVESCPGGVSDDPARLSREPFLHQRAAQAAVQRLAELPGVRVTGTVPDVRPYLAHARLSVAPLRIARGVQNKVLEALAMARPVVATPAALEGLVPAAELQGWAAREPAELARRVLTLLTDDAEGSGWAGWAA